MQRLAATDLAVPTVDTSGRQLALSTEPTPHVAVASLLIEGPEFSARLDVLAASHRVTVELPVGTITETVACDVTGTGSLPLPEVHAWVAAGERIGFQSSLRCGREALTRAAAAIARLDPARSIVVRFPGHEAALTAIELLEGPQEVAWRTWHLYPGDDPHVVITKTARIAASLGLDRAIVDLDLQGVS